MEPSAKFTKSFRKEDVERDWYVVDAADKTLGRVSTQIASILRGKHKPIFTPHVDTGDFVVVVNADKIKVKGKRNEQKEYFRHTGYIGNQKITSFKEMQTKHPARVVEFAVKGMLPKNRLGRQMFKKLKVYAGGDHPHEAQSPKTLELN